ncbi:MAG: OmpW family outer membrane protein [Woeseiaceae bacterium]|nr:OmpW family outer membrane protein [Woeseiaceae bacterium]
MSKFTKLILSVAALTVIALPAQAYEKGDWLVRVGVGMVDPKSDNSPVANVDSGTSLVVNGTYFFTPNIGFEVLAAWPFSHDVELVADGSKVGETKHLPPTFSLQYHFDTNTNFRPYAGIGLNYTTFFDEETTGALTGTSLSLDDSFGLAAQLGADFDVSDNLFLNVDIRWINIETDASIPEVPLSFDVEIDPMVYSIALGWKF